MKFIKYLKDSKEHFEQSIPKDRVAEFDDARLRDMIPLIRHAVPYEVTNLFYAMYGYLPNSIKFNPINCGLAIDLILKKFEGEITNIYHHSYIKPCRDLAFDDNTFMFLMEDVMLYFDDSDNTVTLLFRKTSKEKLLRLKALLLKNEIKQTFERKVNLIIKTRMGLELETYELKDQKTDIDMNYNEDFKPIHKTILERLQSQDNKGLLVLHGKPGTGKTSYIKSLLSSVQKKVIILPPDMAFELTNPSLLSLIRTYPNSILVIEDAEQIVVSREISKSSPVSAILNMTDGILADILNIQIICTFNTDISRIDSALLRKGRLIAKYEFKELEVPKAFALAEKLGLDFMPDKPMTLTDIYNLKETAFETKKMAIGF